MNLHCDSSLAQHLIRNTQRARVISEAWFNLEGYCLNCTSDKVEATVPGTVARDFECPVCAQPYELKSAARAHTKIVQDGGFDSMMRRIRAQEAPTLMLMHYAPNWSVQKLIAVHPLFLTSAVIRKRPKPHLRPKTGQPYWMCDLDLTVVPPDGKIVVVRDAIARPPEVVRAEFQQSLRFAEIPLAKRGWATLVLAAVRRVAKREFTLADVYADEVQMHAIYPKNNHIRPKIRQQMQVLRDLGYIEFLSERGEYRLLL